MTSSSKQPLYIISLFGVCAHNAHIIMDVVSHCRKMLRHILNCSFPPSPLYSSLSLPLSLSLSLSLSFSLSLSLRHHAMNSAGILLYALTSFISGFVSVHLFKKMGGQNWVWNVILTSSLFSVPFFLVWSFLNTVAWAYQSTQALPFTTVVLIMFIWIIGNPLLHVDISYMNTLPIDTHNIMILCQHVRQMLSNVQYC